MDDWITICFQDMELSSSFNINSYEDDILHLDYFQQHYLIFGNLNFLVKIDLYLCEAVKNFEIKEPRIYLTNFKFNLENNFISSS